MSKKENKAQVRGYIEEVWNKHSVERVSDFVAKDVAHRGRHEFSGRDKLEQVVTGALIAFPNFRLTVEDEIAAKDKVMVRWTTSATHQGEFLGVPATGKSVSWSGMSVYRLADGKIVEMWAQPDNMSLMQQLGAIPTPGQG